MPTGQNTTYKLTVSDAAKSTELFALTVYATKYRLNELRPDKAYRFSVRQCYEYTPGVPRCSAATTPDVTVSTLKEGQLGCFIVRHFLWDFLNLLKFNVSSQLNLK
jgi:hypothetical protein